MKKKVLPIAVAVCAYATIAETVHVVGDSGDSRAVEVRFDFGDRSISLGRMEVKCPGKAKVTYERVAEDAMRVHVETDGCRIEDARPGPASAPLKALWYGNGHYVLRPGAFSIDSNGHANSTSFDGFDFENGVSVVMASTVPVCKLYHDPKTRRCGISVNTPGTFTFVAGTNGAAASAIRYRKLFPPKPAPGVAVKAGRFCVDLWNGTFADHTRLIERLRKEVLGDDVVVYVHNWQRFGYDVGLPDVFPPNPKIGTAAELRRFLDVARSFGWYAGVHINTIDAYPDAPSFDGTAICVDEKGSWIKAWYNAFAEKQSYRVRPDRQPDSARMQMESLNAGGCAVDTVFVDVIGSFPYGVMDRWYEADGRWHGAEKAAPCYGEVFDVLRSCQNAAVGRKTFTSSEAAHDFLVGHLDGGDCQWLEVQREEGEYSWYPISEYELAVKVPWFDMVNHSAFSLHGVGYSIRYESGRGALFHGADSDDYLAAQILTGHPPMVECYTRDVAKVSSGTIEPIDMDRSAAQATRQYRLLQKAISELAGADIDGFEFANGDPYRQTVRWSNGTTVRVNRGVADWQVAGKTLAQYGWFSTNTVTGTMSALYRENGLIVEESSHFGPDGRRVSYRKVRDKNVEGVLPLVPVASGRLEGRKLSVKASFERFAGNEVSAEEVTATFWLVRRKRTENQRNMPDIKLLDVRTVLGREIKADFALPPDISGKYDLLVSLVRAGDDPSDASKRLRMLGTDSFYTRYHLGRVTAGESFVPYVQPDRNLYERAFPVKTDL